MIVFLHQLNSTKIQNFFKNKKKGTFTPRNVTYCSGIRCMVTRLDFTLNDCLFGGVKLAKNADSDKYVYSGYGIEFDSRSEFLLPESSVGKSVIKFGVDRAYLSILIIKKKI